MVTRPIIPPWDEGSKNTAWQIASKTCEHKFYLMTTQNKALPKANSVKWIRTYTDKNLRGIQRFKLLLYLMYSNPKADIYHFLFVPTLLTSLLLYTIVMQKNKRSIQTVPTLYRPVKSSKLARLLFFGDKVVVLSDWTADKLYSLGLDNIVRINAGVDLHRFRPVRDKTRSRRHLNLPESKILALFSGELSRLGSLEIMLSIAPQLIQENSNLHLVFASPTRKPEDFLRRKEAERLIRSQGLEKSVTFLGDVDDILSLLNACDMLLYPVSTMLGKIDTPLTVLEAMASELPVILTDLPPLNEVFKDETAGVAVLPGDNQALVRAILELADDKMRRCKMGKKGRRIVEDHYSLQDMVQSYKILYNELT